MLDKLQAELEIVRSANKRGELQPAEVYTYARTHKKSALHKKVFAETDAALAYAQRLDIIRDIIRVHVVLLARNDRSNTKVVVPYNTSLTTSRGSQGGYKPIVEIMANPTPRKQLLIDVIHRLQQVKEAWLFPELLAVTSAIDDAAAGIGRKKAA